MGFLDKFAHLLQFYKKSEVIEYFFALNIGAENLTAALWTIHGNKLKVLDSAEERYESTDGLTQIADKLLDAVLGIKEIEPQKILFGVPDWWLTEEDLKEEYLKVLRDLVKELELTPMAYVATSHALVHFLEKKEGVVPTAILVGFEDKHITVSVVRAGKLDGTKVLERSDQAAVDIEKALLTFTSVETLPSKILIYGDGQKLDKIKNELTSFSWMSRLSFLHIPRIDILPDNLQIKSICLAGAAEIQGDVILYEDDSKAGKAKKITLDKPSPEIALEEEVGFSESFGFEAGDISGKEEKEGEMQEVTPYQDKTMEIEDFPKEETFKSPLIGFLGVFGRFRGGSKFKNPYVLGFLGIVLLLLGFYLFFPKAEVKIFVEPRILEKDTQVTADPNLKEVNEQAKIIPGQIVETEVSSSAKDTASGKKQIGESAKGTVVLRNKTDEAIKLVKGVVLTSSSGAKFTLEVGVTVASKSAEDGTFGKATTNVLAQTLGPDGNLSSGTDLTVSGTNISQLVAKAEGNFSGGTSKEVTVVSDADQKRLLASLASNLRRQAQQKLQEKLPDKKVLEEGLSEEILKKSFSKNVNDVAQEFSLNLTAKYKGTAFDDKDLKTIVSQLVTTEVPQGFKLNLGETETQADVSKLEKDGKLIFLARFRAKLMPEIDIEAVKGQIKFKVPNEVITILKNMENVLGAEIKINPNLPIFLQRLPILEQNIKIEVGLK